MNTIKINDQLYTVHTTTSLQALGNYRHNSEDSCSKLQSQLMPGSQYIVWLKIFVVEKFCIKPFILNN